MLQGALIKWALGGVAIIGVLLALFFMRQQNAILTLERDAAVQARDAYQDALEAYQNEFAAQVKTLDAEKRAEIVRQENLLRIYNLIGDMNESENLPVAAGPAGIINRMYAPAGN